MEKQIKSIKKEKTMNGQVHFTLPQWWPAKDCTSKSHAGWLLNVTRRVRVCVCVCGGLKLHLLLLLQLKLKLKLKPVVHERFLNTFLIATQTK